MTKHTLIYHGLVSRYAPLAIDLEIMRVAGFDGLEISATKMKEAIQSGIGEAELSEWLKAIDIPGIGFLLDIERQNEGLNELMNDAQQIFHLAKVAGAKGVQVLTGPVQVQAVEAFASGKTSGLYDGLVRLPRDQQIDLTAQNLRKLADVAMESGLLVYLESLAWTPLNRLSDQVEIIRRVDRQNVRLVVDYWHCYASGDTPDDVAKLDGRLIYGVHVCDSLSFAGGIPNEVVLRDIPTGKGVLDLREWTNAVKSTGYVGWWSCELFCRRNQQENSFVVAKQLHDLMAELVSP